MGAIGTERRTGLVLMTMAAGSAAAFMACFSSEGGSMDPTEQGCELSVPPADGPRVVATIADFSFIRDSITISPGTTVTWINCEEPVPNAPQANRHTVTSDGPDGPLDSTLLSRGEAFSYTFETVGTYRYHCTPHPFMQAVVVVREET